MTHLDTLGSFHSDNLTWETSMPHPGDVLVGGAVLGFVIFVIFGIVASTFYSHEWRQWSKSNRFPGLSLDTLRRLLRGDFDAELPRYRKVRRLILVAGIGIALLILGLFLVALVAWVIK